MKQDVLPSQGNVDYLEALEIAVIREIKAMNMYETMAKYVESDHMKNKLAFLASEEKSHRENLEDLHKKISGRLSVFGENISMPSEEKIKEAAKMDLKKLLRTAMEKETEAQNFYLDLAGASKDDSMRIIFDYLAEEEANHRRILEVEVRLLTRQKPIGVEVSAEMVPSVYKEWW